MILFCRGKRNVDGFLHGHGLFSLSYTWFMGWQMPGGSLKLKNQMLEFQNVDNAVCCALFMCVYVCVCMWKRVCGGVWGLFKSYIQQTLMSPSMPINRRRRQRQAREMRKRHMLISYHKTNPTKEVSYRALNKLMQNPRPKPNQKARTETRNEKQETTKGL